MQLLLLNLLIAPAKPENTLRPCCAGTARDGGRDATPEMESQPWRLVRRGHLAQILYVFTHLLPQRPYPTDLATSFSTLIWTLLTDTCLLHSSARGGDTTGSVLPHFLARISPGLDGIGA